MSETQDAVKPLFDNPRLAPLLPMLYVAWADGVLSEQEVDAIRDRTSSWLDDECKDVLAEWLDPDNPPTSTELLGLLRKLRSQSHDLNRPRKMSLVDLGMQIGEAETDGETWVNEEVKKALEDIEGALGFVGPEASRDIIPEPTGEAVEITMDEPEPAFDIGAMTEFIDGPYRERKKKVRDVLSRPEFHYAYDTPKKLERQRVWGWLETIAEDGLGQLAFPDVTTDEDLGHFLATFETLAFFEQDLVVKFGVQFGLFGGSIYFLGTEKHHEEYLERIANLELAGCFAMTELGHGSNVRDLETVARFDDETDEWVIHTPSELARKEWIGNAADDGRMATVFAQLEVDGEGYGVHAFLVPIRDETGDVCDGVKIEDCGHKKGLNGVDNGRIWFDHVRVPRTNLLDRFATVTPDGDYDSPIASPTKRFFVMLGTLVGGRVAVGGAALSAAKSALTITTRYSARRRQFGPSGEAEMPILDYRQHQRRLMPRLARAYAIGVAHHRLVEQYLECDEEEEEDARHMEAFAAGLKSYSTWSTIDTIQTCRECTGGQGYLSTNRFGALGDDTDIYATFEGDNTVLMQLVAKARLTKFQEQFADTKVFGIMRYLAKQATTAVSEMNPVITRNTDVDHLRDPDFHLSAFRYRENQLVASCGRRLKARMDEGMDPFDAVNDIQDHVIAVANAYIERLLIEEFCSRISACEDPDMQGVLKNVCDLFALNQMLEDMGWFMEEGYVEPPKARAIRTQVNELCAEVRQQAVHLVDAFDIPDNLLAAPIGLGEMAG